MYKQFYGLKRNPFEISPDPSFYCPTPLHNEALANLLYGIERRKGFVVVTGEVGTGKTLLVQCLLRWLAKNHISFSHVFNTRLAPNEFLQYVLADLGLPITGKNKSELLLELNQHLISRYRQGSTTALIVDEGQLLEWDVLEEIRLLTNLETSQQKLLQIVLIGQPELEEKLDSNDLRQLKQRIAFRCNLKPLSESETRGYILQRLEIAGAKQRKESLFTDAALDAIMRYSHGIPRLVNTICENALIAGYARQAHAITPDIVEQIAIDFRLDQAYELRSPKSKRSDRDDIRKDVLRSIQLAEVENVEQDFVAERGAKA